MPGLIDFIEEQEDKQKGSIDFKAPNKKQVEENSDAFLKGTLSQALAPKAAEQPKERLGDLLFRQIYEEQTGDKKSPIIPKITEEEAKELSKVKKIKGIIDLDTTPKVFTGAQGNNLGEGVLGDVLTALGVGEYTIVAGINKAMGAKPKENFSDNTYYNLAVDLGADPDAATTHALGLFASIFADPITYISFGAGKTGAVTAKMLDRSVGLTKAGRKAAAKAGEAKTQKMIEAGFKGNVTKLAEKNFIEAGQNIVDKLGPGNTSRLVDLGGIKMKVPSGKTDQFFDDVTLVSGQRVKQILDETKASKVYKNLEKAHNSFLQTDLGKSSARAAESLKKTMKGLGGEVSGDKQVIELFDEFTKRGRSIETLNLRRVSQWLSKLDGKQRAEFSETLIQASVDSNKSALRLAEKLGRDLTGAEMLGLRKEVVAPSFAKARKLKESGKKLSDSEKIFINKANATQQMIDRWHGQGKFKGRKSMAEKLKKHLPLAQKDEIPLWFPGIVDERVSLKIGPATTKAQWGILRKRLGDPKYYSRNPVTAIATRRTQTALLKLQDELYNTIAKSNIGDPKNFDSIQDALSAGYVPLRKPINAGVDPIIKSGRNITYIKADTAEALDLSIKKVSARIPFFSWANDWFKAGVTSSFPAFHAVNTMSNIVFNAYSIGGQAINPKTNLRALRLVAKGLIPKFPEESRTVRALVKGEKRLTRAARKIPGTPGKVANWMVNKSFDFALGRNMNKKFLSEIGEPMSLDLLLKEMDNQGVIDKSFYVADVTGATLDKEAQTVWQFMFQQLDPHQNVLLKPGKNLGTAVETHSRAVNYITHRMQGLSPRLSAIEVDRALFDYQTLTKEQAIAKQIIPFYTFAQKNLAKHIEIAKHTPGVIAAQLDIINKLAPTQDEWEGMPPWARDALVFKIGGEFFQSNFVPLIDALNLVSEGVRGAALRVSPVFRYMGESLLTERDFFTGRRLEELQNGKEFKFVLDIARRKDVPSVFRKPMQELAEFMQLEEDSHGKILMDPDIRHLLGSSPISRVLSTAKYFQDDERPRWEKTLRYFMGINRLNFDPDRTHSQIKKETLEKLRRIYVRTKGGRTMPLHIVVNKNANPIENEFYTLYQDLIPLMSPNEMTKFLDEVGVEFKELEKQRVEGQFPR